MRDLGNADELVTDRYTYQNKDSNAHCHRMAPPLAKGSPLQSLKARVKAGEGYEHLVHANLTYVSWDTRSRTPTPNIVLQGSKLNLACPLFLRRTKRPLCFV